MKAAIMYPPGDGPHYADVPAPVASDPDHLLLRVRAAALKHFDKGRAAGTHYSSPAPHDRPAQVIGGDAVGTLADGTRVFALGVGGTLAENALIDRRRLVRLPAELDDATAAALPNAVIGAGMALRFRAGIRPGETVLINGATGFTGRVAVQLARHYGAGRVIATGRNPASLHDLRDLGADEVVSVQQDDEALVTQLRALHAASPIDVIIDYLWGPSAELLLRALRGTGAFTHRVRFVSVGTVLGDAVGLSGALLRSTNVQLSGSGLGSWSHEETAQLFTELLPEAFQLAAEGRLRVATVTVRLPDIAQVWNMDVPSGERLVVMI